MNLKLTLRSTPALHHGRHRWTCSALPSTSTTHGGGRLPQIVCWVCCVLPTLRWPTRKGCASRCCMQQMDERSRRRCCCSAGEIFKLLRLWGPRANQEGYDLNIRFHNSQRWDLRKEKNWQGCARRYFRDLITSTFWNATALTVAVLMMSPSTQPFFYWWVRTKDTWNCIVG